MQFTLYKIILNLKWFCSSIIRCSIAGIWLTIPFIVLNLKDISLSDFLTSKSHLIFIGGFVLLNSFWFWIIGYGLGEFHPPIKWKKTKNGVEHTLTNTILTASILVSLFLFINNPNKQIIWLTTIPLISVFLFTILLINRKLTNEDPILAKSHTYLMTPKNITSKQLRHMRISSIILGLSTMVLLFLYISVKIQLEEQSKKMFYQKIFFDETKQELNAQIDSLRIRIEQLK